MATAKVEKLRALWKLAVTSGKEVRIPCPSPSGATKLRWAMYNAVKTFRSELTVRGVLADSAMQEALENYVAAVVGSEVIIRRRMDEAVMTAIDDLLEQSGAEVPVPLAEGLEQAGARLFAELRDAGTEDEAPTRSTPYFTR